MFWSVLSRALQFFWIVVSGSFPNEIFLSFFLAKHFRDDKASRSRVYLDSRQILVNELQFRDLAEKTLVLLVKKLIVLARLSSQNIAIAIYGYIQYTCVHKNTKLIHSAFFMQSFPFITSAIFNCIWAPYCFNTPFFCSPGIISVVTLQM